MYIRFTTNSILGNNMHGLPKVRNEFDPDCPVIFQM